MADHAHHRHVPGTRRTLVIALVVTLGYAVVEFIAGAAFHSLALLSDAGHMLSDALALGLAAFASWVASRPAGKMLQTRFGIAHVTLQPEPAGGINPGYRARVKIFPQQNDRVPGHGHGHHDHDH